MFLRVRELKFDRRFSDNNSKFSQTRLEKWKELANPSLTLWVLPMLQKNVYNKPFFFQNCNGLYSCSYVEELSNKSDCLEFSTNVSMSNFNNHQFLIGVFMSSSTQMRKKNLFLRMLVSPINYSFYIFIKIIYFGLSQLFYLQTEPNRTEKVKNRTEPNRES
jgi:hypothetical protein